MIRTVFTFMLAFCLISGLAAADPIITEQSIEPAIDFGAFQVVQDAANAEHIFTVGLKLLHFYRDGEYWQAEQIDYAGPSAIIAAVPFRDHFVVFYYQYTHRLWSAEGNAGAWQRKEAPFEVNDYDLLSACATDERTLWLFMHVSDTNSIRAYRRYDGVWDDAPLMIDDDGDCGVWMSAASRGDHVFHLVYQAGAPYYDLRYARYDGANLTKSTILADGEQGEYLSLAADAEGILHLSAWDGLHNDLIYGRSSPAGDWTFTTADSTWGAGKGSAIAVDQLEHPAIAYFDEGRNLALSRWDGSDWEKEIVDGTLRNPVTLGLSFSNSQPAVSVMDLDPISVLASCRKNGEQWSRREIARASLYTGLYLMSDAASHAVLLAVNGSMFSLWRNLAGVYRRMDFYPDDPRRGYYIARGAIDANDRIYIAGASFTSAANNDYYKLEYWLIDGEQATRETILETDVESLQFAVDTAGRPHLLFAVPSPADANELILYSAYRNDEGWEIEELTDRAPYEFNPRMCVDKNGHIQIVFSSTNEDGSHNIYYGIETAGAWSISYVTRADEREQLAFAVDDAATPFITYNGDDWIHFLELCGEEWQESTVDATYDDLFGIFQMTLYRHDNPVILSLGQTEDPFIKMFLVWKIGQSWGVTSLGDLGADPNHLVYDLVASPSGPVFAAYASYERRLTLFDIRFPPPAVNFRLSDKNVVAGDYVKVEYEVENGEQPTSYALMVLLEVPLGDSSLFYSWPGWQPIEDGFALTSLDLSADETRTGTILDLTWPQGAGSLSALAFWAALLDPSGHFLQADLAHAYFSYY